MIYHYCKCSTASTGWWIQLIGIDWNRSEFGRILGQLERHWNDKDYGYDSTNMSRWNGFFWGFWCWTCFLVSICAHCPKWSTKHWLISWASTFLAWRRARFSLGFLCPKRSKFGWVLSCTRVLIFRSATWKNVPMEWAPIKRKPSDIAGTIHKTWWVDTWY